MFGAAGRRGVMLWEHWEGAAKTYKARTAAATHTDWIHFRHFCFVSISISISIFTLVSLHMGGRGVSLEYLCTDGMGGYWMERAARDGDAYTHLRLRGTSSHVPLDVHTWEFDSLGQDGG